MNKWEEKRFSDIATIVMGQSPASSSYNEIGEGIPFLQGNRTFRIRYPEIDMYTTEPKKIAHKNSILMSVRAPVGDINFAPEDLCIGRGLCAIESKVGSNDFLVYLLKYNIPRLKSAENGTTFSAVNGDDIRNLKIRVPSYEEQECIANILSTYDYMIETNNQRIELLEQTAQELYKEWFVRFRFPGYETVKFENGLPEGWKYRKFKDELNYNTGKLDSNAAVPDGEYSFYTCAKTVYKTNTYCFDGECVLLGGNNATGDFSLFYANEKLDSYQRTYIVTPQNSLLSCVYIYFVLKDYLLQFKTASIGATTKFLTKGMLDKSKILIPDEQTILQYNKITKNMFEQIISLKKQNENLAAQRDMLLPRLLSGKLEV